MQVVVTAAGRGKRFSENGYAVPKPAVLLGERPAVTYLMDCFPKEWSQIFVLAEDGRASQLEKIITEKNPHAKVIYTSYSERGPIDTVLRSLPFLKSDDAVLSRTVIWRFYGIRSSLPARCKAAIWES